MKFRIIIAIILCCLLSGCTLYEAPKTDRSITVAALGFDGKDDKISVSAEVILINAEDPNEAPTPLVITKTAKTIEQALTEISDQLPWRLVFEHCGVIIIGETINDEWLDKVCEYLFRKSRITLSAYFISANDTKNFLSGGSSTTVSTGYEIMEIIRNQFARTGKNYKNRFFEIEGERQNNVSVYALPFFKRTEEGILNDGIYIYQNDNFLMHINNRKIYQNKNYYKNIISELKGNAK